MTALTAAILFVGPATAGHLAPIHPLVVGGDHSHENHSGDDHSGEALPGINLSFADLSAANLSGADLSSANLNSADLCNVDVTQAITAAQLQSAADVRGVDLRENDLSGFNLSLIDLTDADLTSADVTLTDFTSTILNGAKLYNRGSAEAVTDVQLQSAADVRGVTLRSSNLEGFNLSGLDFTGANMHIARLEGADLTSTNLSGVDLSAADLRSANLTSANLSGADLRNSRAITDVQLQSAANVTAVNLAGNDLSGFNLSGLDFSFANLSSTNLTSATLTSANLTSVNFNFATLPSAMPTLPVISGAVVSVVSPLDVAGATIVENGGVLMLGAPLTTAVLNMEGGNVLASVDFSGNIAGYGTVLGNISGAGDKTITASGGGLTLGQPDSTDGFDFSGTFDVGANSVILLDADRAQLGSLTTLGVGGVLITLSGAELAPGDALTATGPATVLGNFTNNGTVDGGQLLSFLDDVDGNGSYAGNVLFTGRFSPGNSPAIVNVENVTFGDTAVLEIEIGGLTPGADHDQIVASGTAILGGTLQVNLIDSFLPNTPDLVTGGDGDSFTIITANQVAGKFGTITSLDYDNVVETGRIIQVGQTASDLALHAFQAVAGDNNMDRQVNSTDLFLILAGGKFNTGPSAATWIEGDYNNDDEVNSDDLFLMLASGKYNAGPYSSTSTGVQAVPEPSAWILGLLALLGLLASARRLRRGQ